MSSYQQYAEGRKARMGDSGLHAVEVFHAAHSVGEALGDARRSRNLSQTALASLSGVDQGDISRIERGVTAPTTITLSKLAGALKARIRFELDPTTTP